MGRTLLIGLYIACELIANVTAGRPVFLFGIVAPGGVFIYALTFTLIDLVNERLGRAGAQRVVAAAFAANLLLAFYSAFILLLPSPSFFTHREEFNVVLGSTPRVVGASLLAYLASSLVDVEVFAAWKRKVRGPKWVRVLTSNAVSTAVDSVLFVVLAFAGTLPVLGLMGGQYFIKMGVTLVSLPLIYAAGEVEAEEKVD